MAAAGGGTDPCFLSTVRAICMKNAAAALLPFSLASGHQTGRRPDFAQAHSHLKLDAKWAQPLRHGEVECGLITDLNRLDSGHGPHRTPRVLQQVPHLLNGKFDIQAVGDIHLAAASRNARQTRSGVKGKSLILTPVA